MMEEYGFVLDYLSLGKSDDVRREPTVFMVGEKFFTLLEAVTKKDLEIAVGDRLYIGKELNLRKEVDRIRGRIEMPQISSSARSELKTIIKKIVRMREPEFVTFINKCGPITIRQHQLELLPGVGKKHLAEILDEREKKPFESFDDMLTRIPHMLNPADIITERVVSELNGVERYFLFTRPPTPPHEQYGHSSYGGGHSGGYSGNYRR
jgi:putative nucleotide binding protein